jgi:hypothetical protein
VQRSPSHAPVLKRVDNKIVHATVDILLSEIILPMAATSTRRPRNIDIEHDRSVSPMKAVYMSEVSKAIDFYASDRCPPMP